MKNLDLIKIVIFTTIAVTLTRCPQNRNLTRIQEAEQQSIVQVDSATQAVQELIEQAYKSQEKRTKLIVRQELLNFLIKETDLDRGKTTLSDIQRDLELLETEMAADTAMLIVR